MRRWKFLVALAIINIIWAGFFQLTATAEQKNNDSSISITAVSLELNQAKSTIVFEGSVYADSGDSIVKCDRMEVFYIKDSSASGENMDGITIERVLCTGNVDITRSDGVHAKAHKAELFQTKEILVLSGNAIASQDKNSVEGDVITLFLKEKRTVVQSSGSSRVKALIFRNGETK